MKQHPTELEPTKERQPLEVVPLTYETPSFREAFCHCKLARVFDDDVLSGVLYGNDLDHWERGLSHEVAAPQVHRELQHRVADGTICDASDLATEPRFRRREYEADHRGFLGLWSNSQ